VRRLAALAGRWPPLLRRAHTAALLLLPVLLLTGGLIYLPATHTALIRVLPLLAWVHDTAGIAFLVLLFLPLLPAPPARRLAWGDWLVSLGVGAACCLTGVVVWRVAWFPAVWRANAFSLHGLTAVVLGLWALGHAARYLLPARLRGGALAPAYRAGVGRRDFLRASLGGAALAVLAAASLGGVARALQGLGRALGSVGTGAGGADQGWQIYTVTGTFPPFDPATWRLQVEGGVARPRSFTLGELQALPDTRAVRNFQCVTGWVVPGVSWHGVDLATLLAACGGASGGYLTFFSADGVYVDSLSYAQATAPGTLLAYGMDGGPLPLEHGGPLRLVVPSMYGYKSVKWVNRVRVEDRRVVGYWEQRGYPVDADLPPGADTPGGART
jgi:DMSO/TMAO reductase YedYZ molybdopterin-dependent catalytic subunit